MENIKDLVCYSVGEKYDKTMPYDGAVLEIDNNLCICTIGLGGISKEEEDAVNTGTIKADLCYANGIIFVCLRIGNVLTFDMPFNMGLYSEFRLRNPENRGYMMPIILVENSTNTIVAMRVVGLKNDFSEKLYELSRNQWTNKIKDYDSKLTETYIRYSSHDLLGKSMVCNIFEGEEKCEEDSK